VDLLSTCGCRRSNKWKKNGKFFLVYSWPCSARQLVAPRGLSRRAPDSLSKRFRLHCSHVCLTWYLWHIKIITTVSIQKVFTTPMFTAPRYATAHVLFKGCILHSLHVAFFACIFDVWRHICDVQKYDDRYAIIPILFCLRDVPVFLNVCWCVSTSPECGRVDLPIECYCPCILILQW